MIVIVIPTDISPTNDSDIFPSSVCCGGLHWLPSFLKKTKGKLLSLVFCLSSGCIVHCAVNHSTCLCRPTLSF